MTMLLRFDRESRSFDEPDTSTAPTATDAENLLSEVLGHEVRRRGFNDLGFYMDLCAQAGCVKVELCGVEIQHNRYIMGIQADYRCTFSTGEISTSMAPEHLYRDGYYSYAGGERRLSRLSLGDGEYLAGIRTRQGEVTDQVTFVTNFRTLSFGGSGGSADDVSPPLDLSRRIIAFASTRACGALGRLGEISISRNWEVVGPFVGLRELVERRRASVSQTIDILTREDNAVTQRLLVEASDEIFQCVMSFLAPGIGVSD